MSQGQAVPLPPWPPRARSLSWNHRAGRCACRLGTAEELANAIVLLACDAASFVIGQTISMSGGYTMM